MRLHHFLFAAIPVLGFAVPAQAELILFSNLGQPDDGYVSFNNSRTKYGSDFFTDGTARTVTSVTALMENTDTSAHAVTFGIFMDAGGAPGTLVSLFNTPAIVPGGASGTFTATSPGIDLLANTPYWLIAETDELVGRDPNAVYWHYTTTENTDGTPFSTVPGTRIIGGNNGETTYAPDVFGDLMFTLEAPSAVPEPSSLALVTIAGICSAFGRWRRRG